MSLLNMKLQQSVSLAKHIDWKQAETASLVKKKKKMPASVGNNA